MEPWIPAAAATVVGALAFFLAGYAVGGARRKSASAAVSVPAGFNLTAMLALLARSTRSDAAVVLDGDGLIVDSVGVTSEQAQAMAGNLASVLMEARRHGLGSFPAVFEVNGPGGSRQRFRCTTIADDVFIVATLGTAGSPAPEIESEIMAAIPRLRFAAA